MSTATGRGLLSTRVAFFRGVRRPSPATVTTPRPPSSRPANRLLLPTRASRDAIAAGRRAVRHLSASTTAAARASSPNDDDGDGGPNRDDDRDRDVETTDGKKSFLAKLWDRYSPDGQRRRIEIGERLFRAAQRRANDPTWYGPGRIPRNFRSRHALLTLHVWLLHKRLVSDPTDSHSSLLIQEELFDVLWNDTRSRIRAEGVNELTVNKHLKDVQQATFLHCTHYDHAFDEYATDFRKRFEELAGAVWIHVLMKDEEAYDDQLKRLASYVEYQYRNVMFELPDEYFREGRINWGDMPDFRGMRDNGEEIGGRALSFGRSVAAGVVPTAHGCRGGLLLAPRHGRDPVGKADVLDLNNEDYFVFGYSFVFFATGISLVWWPLGSWLQLRHNSTTARSSPFDLSTA